MPKFRKKPVEIEAVQFDGTNADAVLDWINEHTEDGEGAYLIPGGEFAGKNALLIPTLEGDHRANSGDWIIQGVQGEFYPCKPDIFEATYEPVA